MKTCYATVCLPLVWALVARENPPPAYEILNTPLFPKLLFKTIADCSSMRRKNRMLIATLLYYCCCLVQLYRNRCVVKPEGSTKTWGLIPYPTNRALVLYAILVVANIIWVISMSDLIYFHRFSAFNGEMLMEYSMMKAKAPETFFANLLKRHSLSDALVISKALENLS